MVNSRIPRPCPRASSFTPSLDRGHARLGPVALVRRLAVSVLLGAALLGLCGCDMFESGACMHAGTGDYFCINDTLEKCQAFWCGPDDNWEYCAYYTDKTCADIGFVGSGYSESFSSSETPDWTYGTAPASSSSGAGSSKTGACAYFHTKLNRILCEQRASASACPGKFMGLGTTCHTFSCTSQTNPQKCTVSGASSGGGSSGGNSGGGGSCDKSWTCAYDGQAAPMCNWACTQTGDNRTKTCAVLKGMISASDVAECCPICK